VAAPTPYYVDPAINGNSGTGTIGDPFGDLQYALNTVTRDATNGDIFHIKVGTAEVLAASLALTTYGTPAEGAPLLLRGYTATANDGGVGEIDCNGAAMFAATTHSYLGLIDLEIHNFGNNSGINETGNSNFAYHCEIHKGASTPSGKVLISSFAFVINCHIHDAGVSGIGINAVNYSINNYVKDCPTGIILSTSYAATRNLVVDCATVGIAASGDRCCILGNTIYSSTASTGKGISETSGNNNGVILNNIVEGYSGAGGIGISTVGDLAIVGYNATYNNTTATSYVRKFVDLTSYDVALAASPFTNAAGGDFSLATGVSGAIGGAFPGAWYGPASTTDNADIGAVQNGAGTGGAVSISPFKGNIG